MHYKPPVMQCNKDKVRGDHRRSVLKTLILNTEGNSKLMPNSIGINWSQVSKRDTREKRYLYDAQTVVAYVERL